MPTECKHQNKLFWGGLLTFCPGLLVFGVTSAIMFQKLLEYPETVTLLEIFAQQKTIMNLLVMNQVSTVFLLSGLACFIGSILIPTLPDKKETGSNPPP